MIKLLIKFMIKLMNSLIIKLNLKGPDHQHVDVVAFPRVLVVAVSPHGHLGAARSSSRRIAKDNNGQRQSQSEPNLPATNGLGPRDHRLGVALHPAPQLCPDQQQL